MVIRNFKRYCIPAFVLGLACATSLGLASVVQGEELILEEIIVTAQKREENIQDVPVSVSVLQSEELDVLTAGGADIRMLSGRVPSLVMESSFGRAFPRFESWISVVSRVSPFPDIAKHLVQSASRCV